MEKPRGRVWPYVLGISLGVVAGLAVFIALRARDLNDRTRAWIVAQLSDHFHSDVELQSLSIGVFPRMNVTGEGLSLRHHGRTDVPPLIYVERFSFNLGFMGIFEAPRHIAGVYVENLVITMPPRSAQSQPWFPGSKKLPPVIVDEIVCSDTHLVILPKQAGKDPLDWQIHDLVLNEVGRGKPFDFHGNLTNAKPKGEIATRGTFGPWQPDEPGDTPVTGSYQFTDADLGPFPGIAGILSSTGKYSGQLNELEVEGETDTPDFSLDPVNHPVPLHTEYSATVDGTNGDTYLHPVRAMLIKSLILCEGSVVRVPQKGHMITMNVSAPDARIQDILRLAVNSDKPFLFGPVQLKAKLLLPPGKEKALEKMVLDGEFGVEDATWSLPEVRAKLESLSRHAQGQPENEDIGSSIANLRGKFHLEKAVIKFQSLSFSVPGAAVDLVGTYNVRAGDLDFSGHLRMQAKLSQTVTGKKSFFLKLADPFFKKNGAGSEVPIRITGTREHPKFGLALFGGSSKSPNSN